MNCWNGEEFKTIKTTYGGCYGRCKWCGGEGCIACPHEVAKDMQRRVEPLFKANLDDPYDMELMREYFGMAALSHAFGPDGDGCEELEYNACIANLLQILNRDRNEKYKRDRNANHQSRLGGHKWH